jgi:hypothetical protein
MLLHGVPDYAGLMSFRGANVDGNVQVRSRFTLPPYYKPRHAEAALLTPEALQSIDAVAVGMRRLYATPRDYARLKRGFMGAWLSGMQERYGDARLHQFVRATEAVIKPRIGQTKRQFVHRSTLFIGATEDSRTLLGHLFDLRSAAEHLNEFEDLLQDVPAPERQRVGWLRSYQAELLAGKIYRRILADHAALAQFRTDEAIDTFWALTDQQQREQWRPSFDLQGLAQLRHTIDPEARATPMLLP